MHDDLLRALHLVNTILYVSPKVYCKKKKKLDIMNSVKWERLTGLKAGSDFTGARIMLRENKKEEKST